jgi:NTE family protein
VLTDGGVYDNHGVQPLMQRCQPLLVSDGGAPGGNRPKDFNLWGGVFKRVFDTTDVGLGVTTTIPMDRLAS